MRSGGSTSSKASTFEPKALEKREGGRNDDFVIAALKGGGNVSAALRGGPLSERSCQVCKDVARECKEGIYCPFLAKKIEAHLCKEYPKELEEEEGGQAVFRFVKELAASENIRALEVMATNLKPTEQRVIGFVKKHKAIQAKIAFVQSMLDQSKTQLQMEGTAEVPGEISLFLKEKALPDDKGDVSHLLDIFTVMEEFKPFMEKQKEIQAANANDPKKATMHGDSDAVDKFFMTHGKMKGDRNFMKSVLQMSCAK